MDAFYASLPCDLSSLGKLRTRLTAWLDERNLAVDVAAGILLATHEAAVHAIEQADPSEFVNVHAAVDSGELSVDVSDTGHKPWQGIGPGRADGSHGLTVIRRLVESVEIDTGPTGTTIHLLQPL